MVRAVHQKYLILALSSLLLLSLSSDIALIDASAAEPPSAESHRSGNGRADPPQSATVLDGGEAGSILGKEVRSAADEKLGRVIDVIVDRAGAPRAALIDFGGFLGVGSRKIAVAWDLLTFTSPASGNDRITVQTTRDRLNTAPEFREGKPIVVLSARDVIPSTKVTLRTPER